MCLGLPIPGHMTPFSFASRPTNTSPKHDHETLLPWKALISTPFSRISCSTWPCGADHQLQHLTICYVEKGRFYTLRKTNIAPENGCLEDIGRLLHFNDHVPFGECSVLPSSAFTPRFLVGPHFIEDMNYMNLIGSDRVWGPHLFGLDLPKPTIWCITIRPWP